MIVEEDANDEAADASVTIAKRINRLKLGMDYG